MDGLDGWASAERQVNGLGDEFFAGLWGMYDAARNSLAVPDDDVAVVHDGLRHLHDNLTAALEPVLGPKPLGKRPTLARTRRYVEKGGRRLDLSIRFVAGGWNRDIKLVVEVAPLEVSVFLTSWMAQQSQSVAFAEFLDVHGDWVRRRALRLNDELERRYGVGLHLQQSVRVGSHKPAARLWPEDDHDWSLWTGNRDGQAGLGLWLYGRLDESFIVDLARAEAPHATIDAAARIVGGASGRRLAGAHDLPLDRAIRRVAHEHAATWDRLMHGAQLDAMVRDTALGLGEILARFRAYTSARRVRPVLPVPFAAPATEIAQAIVASATQLDRRAAGPCLDGEPLSIEGGDDNARIGWRRADAPWVGVARHPDGTVRLSFHADVPADRFASPLRSAIVRPLRDGEGHALVELVRASGGALAPQCGTPECRARGRCPIDSQFVSHWLVRGKRPSLHWVFPSDGGDVQWLAPPAHVFGGLLLQVLPDPPMLAIPDLEQESWDVFVSTPGREIGFTGRAIADALRDEHLSPWYMEDHQVAGVGIDENTREGIRRSRVVVVVLHDAYWRSPYCRAEFLEAVERERPLVPVAVTADGAPESARDQLDGARAALEAMRGAEYTDAVIDAAVARARSLYGDTIRITLRAGDRAVAAGPIAASVRRYLSERG